MSLPGRVETILGTESVIDRISLGEDATLYTTETRTIVHRAGRLIRDERVESVDHRVETLAVDRGRRGVHLVFEPRDGDRRTLAIPSGHLGPVLAAVLERILRHHARIEPDEAVIRMDRFDELTVVVTDRHLFKHVGTDVWGPDADDIPLAAIHDLTTESGTVATQVVLVTNEGTERIKVPRSEATALVDDLEGAICRHHGVDSIDDLGQPSPAPAADSDASTSTLMEGFEPLRPTSTTGSHADSDAPGESRVERSSPEDDADLADLRATIQRHEERLDRHELLIELLEERLGSTSSDE